MRRRRLDVQGFLGVVIFHLSPVRLTSGSNCNGARHRAIDLWVIDRADLANDTASYHLHQAFKLLSQLLGPEI